MAIFRELKRYSVSILRLGETVMVGNFAGAVSVINLCELTKGLFSTGLSNWEGRGGVWVPFERGASMQPDGCVGVVLASGKSISGVAA